MTTSVLVLRSPQEVADTAAGALVDLLGEVLAVQDRARLALTGGSLGSRIWASVLAHPGHAEVDWSRVALWWGDERWLPAGDPDRNDTQNDAAGLSRLPLDPATVHRVAGPEAVSSAQEAATAYAQTIRADGGGEWDVVLLGMGPDAHIASLFPHHEAQRVTDAITVAVHDSPKPPPTRVSLTFEALRRSRSVFLLVAGADKASAVASALADDADPWDTPAAGVRGRIETVWFVDEAAASHLVHE